MVCLALAMVMLMSACCYAETSIVSWEEFAAIKSVIRRVYLKVKMISVNGGERYDVQVEYADGIYRGPDGDGWYFTREEYEELDEAIRDAIDNAKPFLMEVRKVGTNAEIIGYKVCEDQGIAPTPAPTATPDLSPAINWGALSDVLDEWYQDATKYKSLSEDTAEMRESVLVLIEDLNAQFSKSASISDTEVMLYYSYVRTWFQLNSTAFLQNCIFLELNDDAIETEMKVNDLFGVVLNDYYSKWQSGEYTNKEAIDVAWSMLNAMTATK